MACVFKRKLFKSATRIPNTSLKNYVKYTKDPFLGDTLYILYTATDIYISILHFTDTYTDRSIKV